MERYTGEGLPLEGIRILSLGHVLAAPYGTMVLADLGAEVIKVEPPHAGDDSRQFGPFIGNQSGYFISINRNKKSMTLDLGKKEGKRIFAELVKKSDVVVENFRPGTMTKLGFDFENLRKIKPDIIYASISGFGHEVAPGYENRSGYDIIGQATGGIMSITGQPAGPPTRVGSSIGDILSGLNMAIGILSALRKREKMGEGSKIDIAMMDVVASVLENAIVRYTTTGKVPKRMGSQHPSIAPFDVFKAKGGWVIIAIGNDSLWRRFCKVAGFEDLANDPRFETNDSRANNYGELKQILARWTGNKKVPFLVDLLSEAGIPASPINTIADVVEDPNINHRGMIVEVEQPKIGKVRIANNPLRFSLAPRDAKVKPAPLPGQHTTEILTQLLGYSKEEIQNLNKEGVI
jgi:Predicted acyl-CoA transferases/carnitine dehydratase